MARVASIEAAAVLVAFQAYALVRDWASGSVSDPAVAIVPVLWIDVALVAVPIDS